VSYLDKIRELEEQFEIEREFNLKLETELANARQTELNLKSQNGKLINDIFELKRHLNNANDKNDSKDELLKEYETLIENLNDRMESDRAIIER
jgi:hypothetical protein